MYDLHHIDALASRDTGINRIYPPVKLMVTVMYIALVMSFSKYDIAGLAGMFVYPAAMFILGDISFRDTLRRIRAVLPLICIIGIFNPLLDRSVIQIGAFAVRGGAVSMATLILKGFYTVLAAYLLAATCSAERICLALEILHVPKMIVTQIMLMYRYIFLFLGEVGRISQAYALRAPGQKGIHFKAWGALVGQLLLRSIDRAGRVYESMLLRGFNGSFSVFRQKERLRLRDAAFGSFWAAVLILFRSVPVVVEVGNAVTASFGAR